jgi:hypothetical protein
VQEKLLSGRSDPLRLQKIFPGEKMLEPKSEDAQGKRCPDRRMSWHVQGLR